MNVTLRFLTYFVDLIRYRSPFVARGIASISIAMFDDTGMYIHRKIPITILSLWAFESLSNHVSGHFSYHFMAMQQNCGNHHFEWENPT